MARSLTPPPPGFDGPEDHPVLVRFSDGVEIDVSGPYRVLELPDGLYVVGFGMCCPVDSREEADELAVIMRETREAIGG